MLVSNGSLLDLACNAVELADGWTDGDTGEAESKAVTTQPVADPVETAWRFDTKTSADTNDTAKRSKNIGSVQGLGNRIVISLMLYCDTLDPVAFNNYFSFEIRRSDWRFQAIFASDGLFIYNPAVLEIGTNLVQQSTWQEWTFDIGLSGGVNNAVCDVYLNKIFQGPGGFDCSWDLGDTDGYCRIFQHGHDSDNRITHLDWIKVGNQFAGLFMPRVVLF